MQAAIREFSRDWERAQAAALLLEGQAAEAAERLRLEMASAAADAAAATAAAASAVAAGAAADAASARAEAEKEEKRLLRLSLIEALTFLGMDDGTAGEKAGHILPLIQARCDRALSFGVRLIELKDRVLLLAELIRNPFTILRPAEFVTSTSSATPLSVADTLALEVRRNHAQYVEDRVFGMGGDVISFLKIPGVGTMIPLWLALSLPCLPLSTKKCLNENGAGVPGWTRCWARCHRILPQSSYPSVRGNGLQWCPAPPAPLRYRPSQPPPPPAPLSPPRWCLIPTPGPLGL